MSNIIKHRFEIQDLISEGKYSNVYKALDLKRQRPCAVKLFKNSNPKAKIQYKKEVEVFKRVLDKPLKGFPRFIANGTHGKSSSDNKRKFIVMSKHGFDLQITLKMCGNKFSYKTSLQVGIEIMDRLQFIHQSSYAFSELTLRNILIPPISEVDQQTLTLSDFGDCEKVQLLTPQVTMFHKNLEWLFFSITYMIKGEFPSRLRQVLDGTSNARSKIKEHEIYNYLISLDDQFLKIYKFLKSTDSKPQLEQSDYKTLKDMYTLILQKHLYDNDYRYDWFPILTKIQKHNRNKGLNNQSSIVSNNSNKAHKGGTSKQNNEKQRKGTFQLQDGTIQPFAQQKFDQGSISSPTGKQRSWSANLVDQDRFYVMPSKQQEPDEDDILNQMQTNQVISNNMDTKDKSNGDEYNFLKLLGGSYDSVDLEKKESSKVLLCNKLFMMQVNYESQQLQQQPTANSSSNVVSASSLRGKVFKKSTMLMINERDQSDIIMNLEKIEENSISNDSVEENDEEHKFSLQQSPSNAKFSLNPIYHIGPEDGKFQQSFCQRPSSQVHQQNQSNSLNNMDRKLSEFSVLTIDKFGASDYDENVAVNQIKITDNIKQNPLLLRNLPMKVQSRTFLDFDEESYR